MTNIIQVCC